MKQTTLYKTLLSTAGITLLIGGMLYLVGFRCVFAWIFGIPCPGCGMMRAWQHAIQLDFADAFRMHPLFLLAPAFLFLIVLYAKTAKKSVTVSLLLLAVLFLLVYGIRMLLYFPETAPMQYQAESLLGKLLQLFQHSG